MEHDIIRISDPSKQPVARLTPDGKLRGPLIFRLALFFFFNSLIAGLIGAFGAMLLLR